jgi:15-cis-phytoene synthase
MDVAVAYGYCERVTRTEARNFSYGIRLLPPDKRRALSAVYAFARRVDDIGDGTLPAAEKLARLEDARAALGTLTNGTGSASSTNASSANASSTNASSANAVSCTDGTAGGRGHLDDPVLAALGDAASRFPIPLDAFGELIDGCAADCRGTAYETFDDLLYYCRCVAGSIGRLSLGVFGAADQGQAEPLADALGVALQLTNILRDIREDHGNGRVYLPAEDLKRFGCQLRPDNGRPPEPDALAPLVRFEAERARGWYDTGLRLLPMLDPRSAACTAAMAGIYRRLLDRIAAAPAVALGGRMSLPTWEKAWVAVRSLAGGAAGGRMAGASARAAGGAPGSAAGGAPGPAASAPDSAAGGVPEEASDGVAGDAA